MFRRLEVGALRNVRGLMRKSPVYRFLMGGSATLLAFYNIPTSSCAGKKEEEEEKKSETTVSRGAGE